ncbi:hypothetical protein KI387_010733 [Taxus chinensis]|uniref:Protein kinase domain-containing protein n=1 Tax=Taxus chinensis TaxID=29808 RepID=A0AA38FM65_TAXCH|nr:hypothetical protein KI387_010733 [Taxus chinensis]
MKMEAFETPAHSLLLLLFFTVSVSSWLISYCDGACDVFTCGNFTLDYPFGLKNSGCGDPTLQFECEDTVKGALPLLDISGHQYYILELKHYSKVNSWDGILTLGKTCVRYSEPVVDNIKCKDYRYYNFSFSDTSINCESKFDLPVKEIDLKKPLDETVVQGLEITWTASKHCAGCESGSSIGGGVALAAILALFLIFRVKRRKSLGTRGLPSDFSKQKGYDLEARRQGYMIADLPIFSYEELQEATNFFDEGNELGDGGFGAVYLGKLTDGRKVAVKKLYEQNSRRIEQFINEIQIFASMDHPNLVRLYGCTHPESPVLLLALAYLHSIDPPIFHRDVKSTNILLDENFRAKVADFGLSRLVPVNVSHVTTAPQGTPGYVDPEYHQCFQLTEKSDVYSFGVVLAELISSKLAVDITRQRNEISLAIMAVNRIKTGALDELVDPHLGIRTNPEVKAMVSAVAELALGCLANDRDVRPDMKEVAGQLEEIKQLHKTYFDEQSESPLKESSKLIGVVPPLSPISVQERWPSIASNKSS